jgi:hypothetical protein
MLNIMSDIVCIPSGMRRSVENVVRVWSHSVRNASCDFFCLSTERCNPNGLQDSGIT